jgi:tetratricopeptide (TPR) repeat protein
MLPDLRALVSPADGLGPWDPRHAALKTNTALRRGAARMSKRRWRAAIKALEAGAPAGLARLLSAKARLEAGDPRGALDELESAGDVAARHWLRAYALDRLGREKERDAAVDEAMRRHSELALDPLPGRSRAWDCVARAETLRSPEFSRYREAVPWLRRAAALAPRSAWVWAYLGRGLDGVGDHAGAGRALDRAARLAPDSGWIAAWRGFWRLRRGRPGALADLDRAVALYPTYPFARAWRGGALRRAGKLKEAVAELELGRALEPCYEWTFGELFQARRQARDWRGAAAMITEAHEREMKFTWARRGDEASCRRALAELDAALRRHPRDPLLRAWRAWVLLGLGRSEAPAAGGPAFAHAVAGEAQVRLGRLKSALKSYDRAVALRPCATYLGARGGVRLSLGRVKPALADLTRAVAMNGTVARFQCSLGVCLLALKRTPAALEAFDRALGLDPAFGEALAWRDLALKSVNPRLPKSRRSAH